METIVLLVGEMHVGKDLCRYLFTDEKKIVSIYICCVYMSIEKCKKYHYLAFENQIIMNEVTERFKVSMSQIVVGMQIDRLFLTYYIRLITGYKS